MASLYTALDIPSIRDVDRHLIEQAEIHLKAVGLAGELRAGNADVLLVMEKVYPQLARTWPLPGLSSWMAPIDIGGNEDAIRAVGRMCVSDEHLPTFEQGAVSLLAGSRSRIAVPYTPGNAGSILGGDSHIGGAGNLWDICFRSDPQANGGHKPYSGLFLYDRYRQPDWESCAPRRGEARIG